VASAYPWPVNRDRAARDAPAGARPAANPMFATVVPGLAALVAEDLEQLPGVRVTGAGSDIVLFDAGRGGRPGLRALRTAEGLFAETGRAARSGGDTASGIARRVWAPDGVQRALSAWAADVRPLSGAMTFQVAARLLHERSFSRADLRKALIQAIARDKPRWRTDGRAQLEIWVTEYAPGQLVAGLRLADASRAQPGDAAAGQPGALRPSVAAMMVGFAGQPRDVLLDPCCAGGAVLGAALAAGWPAVAGSDLDPDAVAAARRNVPGAGVALGDVRGLDLPGESVDAVVSRLPVGDQYKVNGEMRKWLTPVLAEIARVTAVGGRVVLLAPTIPNNVMPRELPVRRREPIRTPGAKTILWVCDRVGT
jgi:SAM-dependent methyltransferase